MPDDEISRHEMDRLYDELASIKSTVDSISKTLTSDYQARMAAIEQWKEGHEGWSLREVSRLDGQHREMHDDVFGERGLSGRVRKSEHTLVNHGVVIGLIGALGLIVGSALVSHLSNELLKDQPAAHAAQHQGEAR